MYYKIEKITTPGKGLERYELELTYWEEGKDKETRENRRFATRSDAQNHVDDVINRLAEAKKKAEERKQLGIKADDERTWDTELAYWIANATGDHAGGWKNNVETYKKEFGHFLAGKNVYERINYELLDEITLFLQQPKELPPLKLRSKKARLAAEKNPPPPRFKPGNSTATIWNKIGWIQSVLNFSVEKRRLRYSPIASYKKTKRPKPQIEHLKAADAADFLKFLSDKYPFGSEKRWRYVAALTAINTGMRAGEVWGLKPCRMQPETNEIRITEQWHLVEKQFTGLKGGEPHRDLPMNAELKHELDALIKQGKIGRYSVIFNCEGRPIDHDNFGDVFEADVKAWGGPQITFHGLRHTAATLMIAQGVDLKTVQEIMGHKDIATTSRYLHLVPGKVTEVAAKFSLKPRVDEQPDTPPQPTSRLAVLRGGR